MRFIGNDDKKTPGTVCICHAIKTQQYKSIKYSIFCQELVIWRQKNHLNERKAPNGKNFVNEL